MLALEHRIVAFVALAIVVGTTPLATACGAAEPSAVQPAAPQSNFSVSEARQFRDFPLYWAGESVAGLPLVAVLRAFDPSPNARPVRMNLVNFIYGMCTPAENSSEGRCSPPLVVQVWPACERNPSVYGPTASAAAKAMNIRGVPAVDYSALGRPRVELSTGTSTVVIFANTPELVTEAISALRGVNNNVRAGRHLPPPAEGALEGALTCPYEQG